MCASHRLARGVPRVHVGPAVGLDAPKDERAALAQMTVYHSMAKCWNGFTAEQVLTYAAVASNAANKDDAIDRAVYQAFAEMSVGPDGDEDVAADALGKKFRTDFGLSPDMLAPSPHARILVGVPVLMPVHASPVTSNMSQVKKRGRKCST